MSNDRSLGRRVPNRHVPHIQVTGYLLLAGVSLILLPVLPLLALLYLYHRTPVTGE